MKAGLSMLTVTIFGPYLTDRSVTRQSEAMMNKKNHQRFTEEDILRLIEEGASQSSQEPCPQNDDLGIEANRAQIMRLVDEDPSLTDEEAKVIYRKIRTHKEWSDMYLQLRLDRYHRANSEQADNKSV